MNKIILIGNLTRNPELKELPSGVYVCNMNIAVSRDFGEDGADFFDIKVFNKQAQNCDKFLSKGRKVAVIGRLQNRSYEDKEGIKRYITEVIANDVEFLSPKDNDASESSKSEDYPQDRLTQIDDNQLPF
jgi:single-strand DNA-binding protein